jgi:hypothetical protein
MPTPPTTRARLQFSPAPGFHLFWYRGRLMWMQRELSMNLQVVETVHLAALFGTRQLMEDLLQGVARHAGERRANRLMLYAVDSWSDNWRLADSKPRRSLDSVVLEAGVAKRLHDDIHEFFSRREWYGRMGVPWRRGYLLYGPPGTGKTSVAYALAGELHLKLCAMSLSNAKLTDQMLANQLQNTPPRSLILIEDIDAFFNARDKQDTRITISFSGLLNALDGVGAQEGRIIVLTTNHRERLDPALIRPRSHRRGDRAGQRRCASAARHAAALLSGCPGPRHQACGRLSRRCAVAGADPEDPDRREFGRASRSALAHGLRFQLACCGGVPRVCIDTGIDAPDRIDAKERARLRRTARGIPASCGNWPDPKPLQP